MNFVTCLSTIFLITALTVPQTSSQEILQEAQKSSLIVSIYDHAEKSYVEVDIEDMHLTYLTNFEETYDWDVHKRLSTIYMLYPYLTENLKYTPEQASGIIANICCEGRIGQFHGQEAVYPIKDYTYITDNLAATDAYATGLCQWYSPGRRKNLRMYYEKWDLVLGNSYADYVPLAAELDMLTYELYKYSLFDSSEPYTPETACATVALNFEGYSSAAEDIYYSNGHLYFKDAVSKTSADRLRYAEGIYSLFNGE